MTSTDKTLCSVSTLPNFLQNSAIAADGQNQIGLQGLCQVIAIPNAVANSQSRQKFFDFFQCGQMDVASLFSHLGHIQFGHNGDLLRAHDLSYIVKPNGRSSAGAKKSSAESGASGRGV